MSDAATRARPGLRWLSPFARVTSGGRFVPEIDGLRAIAIGLVLLFHLAVDLQAKSPVAWSIPAAGALATLASFGFRGVEFFFVISGFILGLPFAAHHLTGAPAVRLPSYFLRRVTRLEPPYILALVGAFVLLVLVKGRSPSDLLPHLLAGLVYQHGLIFGTENPVLGVAWSLEVEIQFYLLVPLLARIFAIRPALARRSLLCAAILISAVLATLCTRESRAFLSIARFLHFFLCGFLLVDLYLVEWKARPSTGPGWDLLTLLTWPLLLWTFSIFGPPGATGESFVSVVALCVGIPLLYVAAFRGRITNALLTRPVVTAFGGMCYSIYLLHNVAFSPILAATLSLRPSGSWAIDLGLQALIAIPAVLVPCAIFFLWIEKPCMERDWPQRLWARLRGA